VKQKGGCRLSEQCGGFDVKLVKQDYSLLLWCATAGSVLQLHRHAGHMQQNGAC
jgi:hypothetical protein